jgi:hypothetical protein
MNEGQILAAMATATHEDRIVLHARLTALRSTGSTDVSPEPLRAAQGTPGGERLRHSAATDWLGKVGSERPQDELRHLASAEAVRWLNTKSAMVRGDVNELTIQATGYADLWAGQFGQTARTAKRAFIAALSRVAEISDPDTTEPVEDYIDYFEEDRQKRVRQEKESSSRTAGWGQDGGYSYVDGEGIPGLQKGDTVVRNDGESAVVTYVQGDYAELQYADGYSFRARLSEVGQDGRPWSKASSLRTAAAGDVEQATDGRGQAKWVVWETANSQAGYFDSAEDAAAYYADYVQGHQFTMPAPGMVSDGWTMGQPWQPSPGVARPTGRRTAATGDTYPCIRCGTPVVQTLGEWGSIVTCEACDAAEDARTNSNNAMNERLKAWRAANPGATSDPEWARYSSKTAASPEGWWPLVPDPNHPGENSLVCPQCGSASVIISGSNLGRDVLMGLNYTTLTCNACGNRQFFDQSGRKPLGGSAESQTRWASRRTASDLSAVERWCDQQGLVMKDFPDSLIEQAADSGPAVLEEWLEDNVPLTIRQGQDWDYQTRRDPDYGQSESASYGWTGSRKTATTASDILAMTDEAKAINKLIFSGSGVFCHVYFDGDNVRDDYGNLTSGSGVWEVVIKDTEDLVGGRQLGRREFRCPEARNIPTVARMVAEFVESTIFAARRTGSRHMALSEDRQRQVDARWGMNDQWRAMVGAFYWDDDYDEIRAYLVSKYGDGQQVGSAPNSLRPTKGSARTAKTCSECGDEIESHGDGYHHNSGTKHDHEAKPGSEKESALNTLSPDDLRAEQVRVEEKYIGRRFQRVTDGVQGTATAAQANSFGGNPVLTVAWDDGVVSNHGLAAIFSLGSRRTAERDEWTKTDKKGLGGTAEIWESSEPGVYAYVSNGPTVQKPRVTVYRSEGGIGNPLIQLPLPSRFVTDGEIAMLLNHEAVPSYIMSMGSTSAPDGVAQDLWDASGRDASLGVNHIWTNVRCPAYRTLDPADCICGKRATSNAPEAWTNDDLYKDGNDPRWGEAAKPSATEPTQPTASRWASIAGDAANQHGATSLVFDDAQWIVQPVQVRQPCPTSGTTASDALARCNRGATSRSSARSSATPRWTNAGIAALEAAGLSEHVGPGYRRAQDAFVQASRTAAGQMITTADGMTVGEGARVFDYYDGHWGTIKGIGSDGWFDHVRDGGGTGMLNGERVAVNVPRSNPYYDVWAAGKTARRTAADENAQSGEGVSTLPYGVEPTEATDTIGLGWIEDETPNDDLQYELSKDASSMWEGL